MLEDRTWLAQLQRGEPDGLRRIYEKYKDELLTVAVGLLVDWAAAEDCLHDVFVRLASSAGVLHLHGTLKGYLVACVANRARDMLRSRKHRQPADWERLAEIHPADGESAGQAVIDREETARLYESLAQLPDEQREVIVLHLHGDLTFREIAQQLDISINTVQSRYRYGLDKLRALMSAGAKR